MLSHLVLFYFRLVASSVLSHFISHVQPIVRDVSNRGDLQRMFHDSQGRHKVLLEKDGFLSGSWLLASLLKIHEQDVLWDKEGCRVDLFVSGKPPLILRPLLLEREAVVEYLYSEGYQFSHIYNNHSLK